MMSPTSTRNANSASEDSSLSGVERATLEQLASNLRHLGGSRPGATALGRAMTTAGEFYDLRQYSVGDDARRIDWNVWQRHRQLVVRSSRNHRAQDIVILLDTSGSLAFLGKFLTARRLCLALGYLAVAAGFRVRVCWPISSHQLYCFPAMHRLEGFSSLEQKVSSLEASGPTSLDAWLADAPIRQGSHLMLVTDFLTAMPSETIDRLVGRYAMKTSLFHVEAKEELNPGTWIPQGADLQLQDAESGELLDFCASALAIDAYGKRRHQHIERLKSWASSRQQYYQRVVGEDVLKHVSMFARS